MAAHFTAVLEINKTTVTPAVPARNTYEPGSAGGRDVTEVTRLVIRADTLEALTKRIVAHVALVEE